VLLAAVLGSGLAMLDGTVVNVALKTIGRDLDASLAQLQWISNGYLLSLASLILVGGSLGDHFGRRRVFVIGVAWFAVASLACGIAQTPTQLILARVLQGVGAALLTPGSLAMIQGSFHPVDRRLGRSRRGRCGHRPVSRWLAGGVRQLALRLPHQPATRRRDCGHRPRARPRDT
jgi:MFS family permease